MGVLGGRTIKEIDPASRKPGTSTPWVVAAIAVISLTWGSTYLSYKQMLRVAPPFLLAASRFAIGGALLMWWSGRGASTRRAPTRTQLGHVAIAAFTIFIGSTASIVWSQQYLSSSLAGLLAGTVPLSMTLVGWAGLRERPGRLALAGLGVGFAGLSLLVGVSAPGRFEPLPIAVALFGTLAWAVGSAYSRRAEMPPDPIMSAGLQMLMGAGFLAGLGVATGELAEIWWGRMNAGTALWFGHLAVPCTITYGTYVWLLHARGMTVASSYAYLMPGVAVVLGWWVLDEHIGLPAIAGGALIVLGVAMVVLGSRMHHSLTVSS